MIVMVIAIDDEEKARDTDGSVANGTNLSGLRSADRATSSDVLWAINTHIASVPHNPFVETQAKSLDPVPQSTMGTGQILVRMR